MGQDAFDRIQLSNQRALAGPQGPNVERIEVALDGLVTADAVFPMKDSGSEERCREGLAVEIRRRGGAGDLEHHIAQIALRLIVY